MWRTHGRVFKAAIHLLFSITLGKNKSQIQIWLFLSERKKYSYLIFETSSSTYS